jgi:hypothetical protein
MGIVYFNRYTNTLSIITIPSHTHINPHIFKIIYFYIYSPKSILPTPAELSDNQPGIHMGIVYFNRDTNPLSIPTIPHYTHLNPHIFKI